MANRQALRDLQSRLAQRLAQARTETRAVSWLALECAGLGLLVPLATAGEIFPVSSLLPVPHTAAWFLGVANLRGRLHGVADLAAFLGLRAALAPDTVREHLREQARLVAFNAALGPHCAVLVDRLAGLRSRDQLQPAAASADAAGPAKPAFAGAVWCDEQARPWQEIDLAALARHEQFLAIAAVD